MLEISDFIVANTHENITHESKLIECTRRASKIKIVCPLISSRGMRWLIENKKPDVAAVMITELSVRGLIAGV
jgi:hypothetical protein